MRVFASLVLAFIQAFLFGKLNDKSRSFALKGFFLPTIRWRPAALAPAEMLLSIVLLDKCTCVLDAHTNAHLSNNTILGGTFCRWRSAPVFIK